MMQPDQQFRVVMRGYDPADVDRVMGELNARVVAAESAVAEFESRLEEADLHRAESEAATPGPASFEHLGERVGEILSLAELEAKDLRDRAQAEAEADRKDSEQASLVIRDEADQYAQQRRRDADAEATQVVTDAKRAADRERDAAERDAAARR
jgi:DivIVA domain-containing protein